MSWTGFYTLKKFKILIHSDKRYICNLLLTGFRELFENEQLFDITLAVDGQDFQGHKSLLAASSDYFRAMFTTDMTENGQKVILLLWWTGQKPKKPSEACKAEQKNIAVSSIFQEKKFIFQKKFSKGYRN